MLHLEQVVERGIANGHHGARKVAQVVVVDSVNAEKRRLLQKLLARQTAAGKAEAAAQTQQQIDSLA